MGLRGKLRFTDDGRLLFRCPGCDSVHGVSVGEGQGPRWGFNSDYDRPTFTPSVLVSWSEPSDISAEFDDTSKDKKMICHSFVTDGQIQFLGDCTHGLAGQTVDLPNFSF
jgi:hypothetical protein